jgi:hypothetical protein
MTPLSALANLQTFRSARRYPVHEEGFAAVKRDVPVLMEVANPSSQDGSRYRVGWVVRRGALPRERFSPLAKNGHSGEVLAQTWLSTVAFLRRKASAFEIVGNLSCIGRNVAPPAAYGLRSAPGLEINCRCGLALVLKKLGQDDLQQAARK